MRLPIASAQWITDGTRAILHMKNGRRYDAIWEQRGRVTAWWPIDSHRKRPIGLYDPVEFEIEHGIIQVSERISFADALDAA
jgi:hypothetical protein